MLKKALETSNMSFMDLSRAIKVDKGLLSRTLSGASYRNKAFYDELYNILSARNGEVPVYENIRAYPSGRDLGTWDVYIGDDFFITWRFYNYADVMRFVHKDERFQFLLQHQSTDTVFRNNVRLR